MAPLLLMPNAHPSPAAPVADPAAPLPQAAAHPVAQIEAALPPLRSGQGGEQVLLLQLHPQELGSVEIRIATDPGGARIEVRASRPETLELLRRDAASLHHALGAAGLSPEHTGITFLPGAPEAALSGAGTGGLQGSSPDGSGASPHSGGQGGRSGKPQSRSRQDDAATAGATPGPAPRRAATSLDLTA